MGVERWRRTLLCGTKKKIILGPKSGAHEGTRCQCSVEESATGEGGTPIRLKNTLAHCAVEALVMLLPLMLFSLMLLPLFSLMLFTQARYQLGARSRGRSRRGLGEREAEAAVATVRQAPWMHLRNRDQDPERLGPDRCCRCTCMHVQKKKKGQ